MKATINHLDAKMRLPIPTEMLNIFQWNMFYSSIRSNSLLAWSSPYSGLAYEHAIKSKRVIIGEDLLNIVWIPENDPKRNQVIWIPIRTGEKVEFLLFFWETGQKTWEQMLATKTAVNQLVLT